MFKLKCSIYYEISCYYDSSHPRSTSLNAEVVRISVIRALQSFPFLPFRLPSHSLSTASFYVIIQHMGRFFLPLTSFLRSSLHFIFTIIFYISLEFLWISLISPFNPSSIDEFLTGESGKDSSSLLFLLSPFALFSSSSNTTKRAFYDILLSLLISLYLWHCHWLSNERERMQLISLYLFKVPPISFSRTTQQVCTILCYFKIAYTLSRSLVYRIKQLSVHCNSFPSFHHSSITLYVSCLISLIFLNSPSLSSV